MPLVLQTVGVQAEFEGYYNSSSFNSIYENWNPTFMKISINPVCILQLTKKQSLTIQAGFSSRRSFSTKLNANETDLNLKYTGREWYFNRIALSYCYNF